MVVNMYIIIVWDETSCGFLDTIISDDPLALIFNLLATDFFFKF